MRLCFRAPCHADLEWAVWYYGHGKTREWALSSTGWTLSTNIQEEEQHSYCVAFMWTSFLGNAWTHPLIAPEPCAATAAAVVDPFSWGLCWALLHRWVSTTASVLRRIPGESSLMGLWLWILPGCHKHGRAQHSPSAVCHHCMSVHELTAESWSNEFPYIFQRQVYINIITVKRN